VAAARIDSGMVREALVVGVGADRGYAFVLVAG